ncbi:S-layer homology domain-containing protein [Paenibacillus alba]|uniref:S-layer homology domain-containing protein n=1 Tax=Paenibacillus alba TaxID=1197127 RepID=A0ABU6FWI3_9BACL|nr:S-layer homology domain-containing protein [Paenibacillus alba]MEC0226237.1 S-layer homology domain-containing protein [Paenibacillus alba]
MKLRNRRMLSLLLAIVMVLTMMPFYPLEVRATATPTLDLGTPVRLSTTTYQLSNAVFGGSGVVDAGGGYFTVAVSNGSIAVVTPPGGIAEMTDGVKIGTIKTDQSTLTNRVFNFSSTNTYEDIQTVIRNLTFTQVSETPTVTVNVTPGTPLADGKTSVRTYKGRHFVYVATQSTMTFYDAVTTATNKNGHLVEPAANNPGEMLAIASMFKEFKSPFTAKPGWNFISFIGATKTYKPNWNISTGTTVRYVSTGYQTGLDSTTLPTKYMENGPYDHLTLLLNDGNTDIGYLGVSNVHGSGTYRDPGVIVEYNPGVISNIITATKVVPSVSGGGGIKSVTTAVYKSVTVSVFNGSSTITATPLNASTVMTVTYANGDPVTGLRAFDQNGNEITAGVNGWYPSNGSPIVFLPLLPGGTYKVAATSTFDAGAVTPRTTTETQSITLPIVGNNVAVGKDSGHPGQTTITVNPSSTLVKYAIADENGNVVSGWKTGTGSDLTFNNLNPGTRYQIVAIPAGTTDPLPTTGVSGTPVTTPVGPVAPVDAKNILRMPTSTAGSDLIQINNTAPAIQYALVDKSTGQYVDVHGNLSTEPVWISGNGSTLTFQPVDAAKTYQVLAQPIPAAGETSPMPTSGTDVLPYRTTKLSGGMMYEDTTYPTQAIITVAGVTGNVSQYTGKYVVNGVPVGVYPASVTIANPDKASLNATFTAIATLDDQGNVTFGLFTPTPGTPAGMSLTSDAKGTIIVHPSTAVSQVASDMVAAINTNTLDALKAAHDEFTALTPEEQLQISRTTVENISNAILKLLQASLKTSSAVSGVVDPSTTKNQLDNQMGMLLTSQDIAKVLNGQSLNVTLNLNATDVSTSTTQSVYDDKGLISTLIAPSASGIGSIYDINITKKVDVVDSSGAVTDAGTLQPVRVVPEPIKITLPVPTNLLGYKYFAIVRVHNGRAEFIPCSVNGTTVTFSSTKFSTYALVYSNQMIFADNLPGTGPSLPSTNDGGGGGFVGSTVTIDNGTGGKVTVDNNSATAGTKVTITVTPDAGYLLDKLTITDDKGNVINYTDNGNGTYTYIQPNGTVKIKAVFKVLDKAPALATDTGVFKLLNTKDHFAYLSGYEDGTFRSDTQVTRAEVAQMFYNLLKNQDINTSGMHFADVPGNAWYAKAVNTLASLGIINGYEDGTFAPNKAITRAEFTIIAVSFSNNTAGNKSFTDVSKTHWAYSSIATSAEYGWVNGYPDGTFEPDKTITRAESAAIVNRMLNRQPDKKAIDASTSIKVFKDLSSGYWAYYDIMETTNAHQYKKSNGMEIWVP